MVHLFQEEKLMTRESLKQSIELRMLLEEAVRKISNEEAESLVKQLNNEDSLPDSSKRKNWAGLKLVK